MFIKSIRLSPLRILALSAGFVAVILGILIFALPDHSEASAEASAKIRVRSESDIKTYLSTFGWQVSQSGDCETITIPIEWNQTFENYNTIQKLQGFDLTGYKGKEVSRYTWQILNYPDSSETMFVNVLVCNQKIIGGDISTSRIDGFIHGFAIPETISSENDTASDAPLVLPGETSEPVTEVDPLTEK